MITSSSFSIGHAQIDGRRYVTETHERDNGEKLTIEYLASPGTDYEAVMTSRAAQINEAEAVPVEPAALPDVQQTVSDMLALANNKPIETSAAIKAGATSEQLTGLINATDGYKIEVVE